MIKTVLSGTSSPPSRPGLLTDQNFYLFNEGRQFRAYKSLGAHLTRIGDETGVSFGVWAPNTKESL